MSGVRSPFFNPSSVSGDTLLGMSKYKQEWHPAYYGVTADGTRTMRLIGLEHSDYEEAVAELTDIAEDDPDETFFLATREVSDWHPAEVETKQ